MKQKKSFEKKIQNGRLKKTEIFNYASFQSVTIYGVPRMGRNFDDYPDFQQKAREL
jgi:hypothetical protein